MKFLLTTLLAAALIGLLAWKLCFPGGGPPNPLPILESHWDDQLYRLDDDEDLRFIPPPFLVRRASEFKDFIRMRLTITGNGQRCYHMTSQGVVGRGASSASGDVFSAIDWCTAMRRPLLEIAQGLGQLPVDGDWVVRGEGPFPRIMGTPELTPGMEISFERRMKALESILRQITARDLIIDRQLLDRQVFIVRGKWKWDSKPDDLADFYQNSAGRHESTGTLRDSFDALEERVGRRIFDEVDEPKPKQVIWNEQDFFPIASESSEVENPFKSIERRTGLKFEPARKLIPVWVVYERNTTTAVPNGDE